MLYKVLELILKTHDVRYNKDDEIYYVNFINNFNKDNDIVLLENTGHYITIERPQWINETILSWLIKLKLHFIK